MQSEQPAMNSAIVTGCLVGQALGDMMGLPFENLTPSRIAKLANFKHPQFFFGYGCGSDDTEHAGLTAEALIYAQGHEKLFQKRLAANLRRWFLAGPPGIGLATLKACVKLCIGAAPTTSGIHSAGNGPVMRAPILGLLAPPNQLSEYVTASTRLTHTDPRAEFGSLLIAKLARVATTIEPKQGAEWLLAELQNAPSSTNLKPLTTNLEKAAEWLKHGQTLSDFTQQLGLQRGVTGFVAHTVPAVIVAFFLYADDYKTGLEQMILAGGDTDTTAAILGGLIGARVGVKGLPQPWLNRHCDWPWTLTRLQSHTRPPLAYWPLLFLRNIVFFAIVLGHLFRRLLPPW